MSQQAQAIVNRFLHLNQQNYGINEELTHNTLRKRQFRDHYEKKLKQIIPQNIKKSNQILSEKDKRHVEIRHRSLVVDSRDREEEDWPNTNKYVLDISSEHFTNVSEVRITSSCFPNPNRLIESDEGHGKNNTFRVYFEPFEGEYLIQLTPGDYIPRTLAEEMELQLNKIVRNTPTDPVRWSVHIEHRNTSIVAFSPEELTNALSIEQNSNQLQINLPNHGLVEDDPVRIYAITSQVGDFWPSELNNDYKVTDIIDANNFTVILYRFQVNPSVSGVGGTFMIDVPIETGFIYEDSDEVTTPFHLIGFGPISFLTQTVPGLKKIHKGEYPLADFGMNKQIFICSNALTGNISDLRYDLPNAFAMIQLPGKFGDTVYNSYVLGVKEFWNNEIDYLSSIDICFLWLEHWNDPNTHSLDGFPEVRLVPVDFRYTEHSFTLQMTENIQKIAKSDWSTRLGSNPDCREFTCRK